MGIMKLYVNDSMNIKIILECEKKQFIFYSFICFIFYFYCFNYKFNLIYFFILIFLYPLNIFLYLNYFSN